MTERFANIRPDTYRAVIDHHYNELTTIARLFKDEFSLELTLAELMQQFADYLEESAHSSDTVDRSYDILCENIAKNNNLPVKNWGSLRYVTLSREFSENTDRVIERMKENRKRFKL